jgi:hypothetical protein
MDEIEASPTRHIPGTQPNLNIKDRNRAPATGSTPVTAPVVQAALGGTATDARLESDRNSVAVGLAPEYRGTLIPSPGSRSDLPSERINAYIP